ncbi:MAG: hypothetical protein IJX99_08445 [Clostridia bacterium]|nr:hypothetical protein [Clostridia bacterium]
MINYYSEPLKVKAHIHTLDGQIDEISLIGETMQGEQKTYIAEYSGKRCTAIFNVFTSSYYADDKYGTIVI